MAAYFNEIEPFAAQWLRNLIAAGHIAPGDVDTRSITEVAPDDIQKYSQAHFFAGIAGWSAALRLAGWEDERPIWTGSCPCQPFSAAGKQQGTADERHLWPEFARLIRECRPPVVAGEQVASALGRAWLSDVRLDLEALGYAVGAADLCAAGVGAPHIRQRLWWVADAERGATERHGHSMGATPRGNEGARWERQRLWLDAGDVCVAGVMADRDNPRLEIEREQHARAERQAAERGGAAGGLGDADRVGPQPGHGATEAARHGRSVVANGWAGCDYLPCRDGKARPTQPGLFPLAHGIPGRVGRLRAYGNAIVPQVAAEFIAAVMECAP